MINVTPISQRDLRWMHMPIGTGASQEKNIGNWGCLMVAYCMMANYWNLFGSDPVAFNAHMVTAGAFSGPFIKPAALLKGFLDQVEYSGYITRKNSNMVTIAKSYLDNDRPVPARVDFHPETARWDQHWVLLIGYDEKGFIMADPWTGKIGPVSDVYDIKGGDVLEVLLYTLAMPIPSSGGDLQAVVNELKAELNKKTQENNELHQKIEMVREILNV